MKNFLTKLWDCCDIKKLVIAHLCYREIITVGNEDYACFCCITISVFFFSHRVYDRLFYRDPSRPPYRHNADEGVREEISRQGVMIGLAGVVCEIGYAVAGFYGVSLLYNDSVGFYFKLISFVLVSFLGVKHTFFSAIAMERKKLNKKINKDGSAFGVGLLLSIALVANHCCYIPCAGWYAKHRNIDTIFCF